MGVKSRVGSNPTSSTNYYRNFSSYFLFLFRLISADPVDDHGLWEDCGLIRPTGPFTSYGDVEEEVEFLMKRSAVLLGDGSAGIWGAINEPLDLMFVPDNFKEVEVVGKDAFGELVLGWD